MTRKKVLITGLGVSASEESVRSWLCRLGPVVRVDIIRDGDATRPIAVVEMELGEGAAANLVSRLNDSGHDGDQVSVHLLNH